ncbi:nucleotidyl transferase AbiEii/AbiGii toxin family protein [Streptomyces sp. NBS 14/10]|uniref:nucleotidyl transferase AbiEii/AbiGii toxin family protein n=1 Tax=Streptomyces sp. NBS 14/10 TaxID=1945643 RepID=UPI00211AF86D|nr:nucleotidyl transferase AbiEii/AbiGii toxin family protein [Streptomyces sp. NBS 14/10]KAK1185667.1 nucleotidyl transferase AbiEii/AbiGii toxin family protein [Streptomyces sp. NBS 14/10]
MAGRGVRHRRTATRPAARGPALDRRRRGDGGAEPPVHGPAGPCAQAAGGGPPGEVRLDFARDELLPQAPVWTPIPRGDGGTPIAVRTASRELSLAWKVLWLHADCETEGQAQGKDLYDAVLLAEAHGTRPWNRFSPPPPPSGRSVQHTLSVSFCELSADRLPRPASLHRTGLPIRMTHPDSCRSVPEPRITVKAQAISTA